MSNSRITPDHITDLKENEIFVFGSNEAGIHGAGAAKTALKWGAQCGEGFGFGGSTFAIPTKDERLKTLSLEKIKIYVDVFLVLTTFWPDHLKFLVTEIGCGLAGYTAEDIAPMFKEAIDFKNVYLPKKFWEVLSRDKDVKS